MKSWNVLVTQPIPQAGVAVLRRHSRKMEFELSDRKRGPRALQIRARGRDGILCLLTDIMDERILESAGPRLKVISNCAVGTDNVDVRAATRRGILVTNTPGVLTEATAELAWALILACARRIPEGDRLTRSGRFRGWDPLLLLGQGISGKTLGIIGAGRIGGTVARIARGFGMNVFYANPSRKPDLEKETGARKASLNALLRRSDFVSLHCPLNDSTRGLIGERELCAMKPTAVLVNTARGPCVDEAALARALSERRIFAAGLDVYEKEPQVHPKLLKSLHAVLLPHLGSATVETRNRMAALAAENLVLALQGERPHSVVNPEALP